MAVDLHTHSTASDGSETPTEVMRLGAVAGLTTVALTDHDNLAGLSEAAEAAHRLGLDLIGGTELSLDWSEMASGADQVGGMHLVVLWLDDVPGPLQDRLAELRDGRGGRNQAILERLRELGMPMEMAEVEARAAGSVGRPHIAAAMVEHGYVPDIAAAFSQYLAQGCPAYVPRRRLRPGEAITLARASGGVPILAHPQTLGFAEDRSLEGLLSRLAELGLVGLETHHSGTEPDRRRFLTRMARRHGLVPSGGSDFHGAYKPGIEMGIGVGDLTVPDEFVAELELHRESPE